MSFRLKTILGVALIESVLLFVLIVSSLDYLRSSNQDELHKRAYTTAELLAATAQDAVLSTDLATLQDFVKEVLTNPGIVYARVLDAEGVLVEGGEPQSLARSFAADVSFASINDAVYDAYADIEIGGVNYGRVELGLSLNAIQQVMQRARRHAFAIAGTELILVALFSMLLGTYLMRELKALRTATGRIAQGDLDYRIPVHGHDELAQTARAFNAMAEQLQIAFRERDQAQDEVRQLNRDLEARVLQRTQELEALNEQLEHQALHDGLTKIPNRTLFNDRLVQQLALSQRSRTAFALAVLDMDRFKEINDVKGHQVGDLVLQAIADRLTQVLRKFDTVARMGGDEFAILLPEVGDEEDARSVAAHIVKAVAQPIHYEGGWLEVGASLGIALYPEHGEDAPDLLRHADLAMYQAKILQVGYSLFRSEFVQTGQNLQTLRGELRQAIEAGELLLHYQPKVDFETGVMSGVEALVRWQHPRRGLLYPDQFIPLAEQTGLIQQLGMFVLRQAMRQCMQWRQAGYELVMAVNISVFNLMDERFTQRVTTLLGECEAEPAWLELEITETGVMSNPVLATQTVRLLSDMGIRLAIDDFGTGYSSMTYLKKLLAAKIKIDKSFIVDMAEDEHDAVIVRSAIELGHNLGLRVVAEGVEDRATWQLLQSLGCDSAQGFFVSQPLPALELERWMSTSSWRPRMTEAAPEPVPGTLGKSSS